MKHKDEIIMNLKDYNAGRKVTGGTHAFESKIAELYEVYSQVSEYEQNKVATTILVNTLKSKADEYEAKAKAFDRLVDTAYWHLERIDPEGVNVLQFESFYKDIRDEIDKYESGESE